MGYAILFGLIVVSICYSSFVLMPSVKMRRISTSLTPEQLRQVFAAKVATAGWSIVDEGDPIVAQSSLIAGRRQQLSLRIVGSDNGVTQAVWEIPRYVTKGGVPYKAHTLRMRRERFVNAVLALDPAAVVLHAN